MEPNEWCLLGLRGACLTASDWAAWMQALGTAAALVIAIAVPWFVHRTERKQLRGEKKLRAKSYALALLPDVEKYLGQVRQARWRFKQVEDLDDFEFVATMLALPERLAGHQINIHELGSAGSLLQDALARMPRLQVLITDHEFYCRYGGEYHEPDGTAHDIPEPIDPEPLFEKALSDLEVALESMKSMFS